MEHVPYYAAWYRARLSWIYNDKVHPTLQIDPEWGRRSGCRSTPPTTVTAASTSATSSAQLEGRAGPRAPSRCPTTPRSASGCCSTTAGTRCSGANVELVTEAVTAVTESGLVDSAGRSHEFDVVIMATGFHTDATCTRWTSPAGRAGRRARWGRARRRRAYLGITVADFPNLFT